MRSIQQFLLHYAQQTGKYQEENKQIKTGHRGKKADGGGRSLSHLSPPHTRITDYSVLGVAAVYVFLQLTWPRESQQNLDGVFCGVANEVVH